MNKVQLTLLTAIFIATAFTISCESQEQKKAKVIAEAEAAAKAAAEAEAARLEAEADAGKASEYANLREVDDDLIRNATLFASEAFAFTEFPFYERYRVIETYNIDHFLNAQNGRSRYIEDFKSLFIWVSRRRETDMSDWLQRYVKLAASLISQEKYVANGWEAMVRQLLIAHEDLAASPQRFREVYEVMADVRNEGEGGTRRKWYNAAEAYASILPFVRDKQLSAFIVKRSDLGYWESGEVNRSAVVLAYSFWGRRWHENPGNIETIAATLRMLRDEQFASERGTEEECPHKTGPLQKAEVTFLEPFEDPEGLSTFVFRLENGDETHFNSDDELVKGLKKGDKASITYEEIQQPFDTQCWNLKVLKSLKKIEKGIF
jgi:hypothetical protein